MANQSESSVFDTEHRDLIHDVQLDFYGKTLATASSDCTIKLFEVIKGNNRFICDLHGHTGPVWSVSWANPTKFGTYLASCGYDRQVIIWHKENNMANPWQAIFRDTEHSSSINCVQWAPSDVGLVLAAAGADGCIYTYHKNHQSFVRTAKFMADKGGVNSISWSHQTNVVTTAAAAMGGTDSNNSNNENMQTKQVIQRFASGGCDNKVKIWRFNYQSKQWEMETELSGHSNWVRGVAWAPIPGASSYSIVASCSEDETVRIWREKNNKWDKGTEIIKMDDKVWSVSWSEMGNILAVAYGENKIKLFKENIEGEWVTVQTING